jgi:hypothetical protein
MTDELQDAADVYEAGKSCALQSNSELPINETTVRKADPNDNEAKMKLAEVYEILNEPRKALDLVYEGKNVFSNLQWSRSLRNYQSSTRANAARRR